MSAWIDIQFAPKDGTLVDLWVVSRVTPGVRIPEAIWGSQEIFGAEGWWVSYPGREGMIMVSAVGKPTHYMPIPEGPR